jgi:hypothetical protein
LESKKSSHRSKSKKKTPKDQDDIGPSEPLKKHRSRSSKKNKDATPYKYDRDVTPKRDIAITQEVVKKSHKSKSKKASSKEDKKSKKSHKSKDKLIK